jgi:hypothetical protein
MNPQGWQARALSWALAIFATLAMVGAVATMSTNGPGGAGRAGSSPPPAQPPPESGDREQGVSAEAPAPFTTGAPPTVSAEVDATRRQADALRDIAGWLAALTYAVLALVAVAAVGVLALFRLSQAQRERG